MRYRLSALHTSKEALAHVEMRVLASLLLQKMVVSSSLPTSLRHTHVELGSLALYNLCTKLGIEYYLKYLRNAIFSDSATGQ